MQVAAHPRTTAKIGPVNRELFVVQRDQVNSVLALGQPQSPWQAQEHIFHQTQPRCWREEFSKLMMIRAVL